MKNWQELIDLMVQDVIGDGDISHLPGAGKPLKLDDDDYTPADQRVSYKIMKDYEVAPDWIMMGETLADLENKLYQQIERRALSYQQQINNASQTNSTLDKINIQEKWETYIEEFRERVGRYNKEVLLYNLKIPKSIPQKQIIVIEKLIADTLRRTKRGS